MEKLLEAGYTILFHKNQLGSITATAAREYDDGLHSDVVTDDFDWVSAFAALIKKEKKDLPEEN